MQGIALLLGAIASVISAVGGVVVALVAMGRGSKTERQGAAEGTAERLLRPGSVDQGAIEAALVDYFEHEHEHGHYNHPHPSPPQHGREAPSDD